MSTINLKLYHTLRKELNLSEEKGMAITQAIEEAVSEELKHDERDVATKDFVKMQISEVRKEISEAKTDIIKWVIAIILGQTALLAGLIKLMQK